MKKVLEKPELLAPAGTLQAGLAAIDAGADAIYMGLPRFNARERGQNCTFEEYSKLLAYAHRHGCRLYVTLNTLIKERELADVVEVLESLLATRPDAVILQDLGVLHLIKRYFPELTPHASTQMGVHNSAGVRAVARLGCKRVILQRQVTYEEIGAIRAATDIELEVFVHGALCTGRSGSCLFSSWMGGWSGNRGRCKQPCRRRYFSDDGNGFFFSPKDLYSLEDLPRLMEMGISSLKIEGRLRRVDYVRNTVEAYRMMLDAAPDERKRVLPEAKRVLARAPGRKWTGAFKDERDFSDVIRHKSIGASGRLVGNVIAGDAHGFQLKLSGSLYLHDVIRIQPRSGDEGIGLTITKLTVKGRDVKKATAGQVCRIGCDKKVPAEALVFKSGSQVADISARIEKLPRSETAIDLDVRVDRTGLVVAVPLLGEVWRHEAEIESAQKYALGVDDVRRAFGGGVAPGFTVGVITADVAAGLFLPASMLKAIRRAFWQWLGEKLTPEQARERYRSRLALIVRDLMDGVGERARQVCKPETVVLAHYSEPSPLEGAILAHSLYDIGPQTQEAVLPEFCAEDNLGELRQLLKKAAADRIRRFRVTSLYGLDLLRDVLGEQDGVVITASYALPVCNSLAFEELRGYGVAKAAVWVELGRDEVNDLLARLGDAAEVICYARLPLLTTRMEIPVEGEIKDSRGARFFVKRARGLTLLLPEKVFAIEPPEGVNRFIDLSHAEWGEDAVSEFNFPRELV